MRRNRGAAAQRLIPGGPPDLLFLFILGWVILDLSFSVGPFVGAKIIFVFSDERQADNARGNYLLTFASNNMHIEGQIFFRNAFIVPANAALGDESRNSFESIRFLIAQGRAQRRVNHGMRVFPD